MKYLLIDNKSE